MCVSFENKVPKPKPKLKYILNFFYTPLIYKSIKNFFLVQICRHLHHLSQELDLQIPRLDDLPPACEEVLHNKIVIDFNNKMKSNEFKHLCYNVYSKEVSLLCFVKFMALVLLRC